MKSPKTIINSLIRKYEIDISITLFFIVGYAIFYLTTKANADLYIVLTISLGLLILGFLYVKATIHKKTTIETSLTKIEIIKIVDCLHELGYFKNHTKIEVMKRVGNIFGYDLNNFQKNLSDSSNYTSEETYMSIFNKMIDAASKKYAERLEKKKK